MEMPVDESKCFENQFVDNVDISQYDIHRLQLLGIEERVQSPPLTFLELAKLRWDVVYCHPRGQHKKSHVVQQCYIPTDRIQDFIEGM